MPSIGWIDNRNRRALGNDDHRDHEAEVVSEQRNDYLAHGRPISDSLRNLKVLLNSLIGLKIFGCQYIRGQPALMQRPWRVLVLHQRVVERSQISRIFQLIHRQLHD